MAVFSRNTLKEWKKWKKTLIILDNECHITQDSAINSASYSGHSISSGSWSLCRMNVIATKNLIFFLYLLHLFYIMIYSQLSSGQTSVPCVFTNTSIITKYHRHSLRKPLARHKFNVAASFHEQRLCETISQKMFPDYDNHTAFIVRTGLNSLYRSILLYQL